MKRKYIFYIAFSMLWLFFRNNPEQTEKIYSVGVYPYIAKTLHFLLGWIPFSFGDVFYTFIVFYAFYFCIKNRKKIWKSPLWFSGKVFFFIMTIACCFFSLWGFNYFRVPLSKTLEINTSYSENMLFQATELYIVEANNLHQKLVKNDSLKVDFTLSKQEIYDLASKSYPLGIKNITDFSTINSVKSSIYSTFLTYMGYSGYLNPFTNEAQVNGKMIGYAVPVTACHEIAHQMGYAAESEANYLGYLAAEKSENLYFKYSAALFALRYLLNETHKVDAEKYKEFVLKTNKGILKNYQEVRDFWRQYENKAEPVFKATYDSFLKANKQKQGIQSYDFVVGLLINLKLKN